MPPAIHLGQGTLLQLIILTVSAPDAANLVVSGAYAPLTSTPEPHHRTRCFAATRNWYNGIKSNVSAADVMMDV